MSDNNSVNSAVPDMIRMAGQIVTICTANEQYTIEEDARNWRWTDDMFSGLADEIECGDAVLEIDDSEWISFFSFWNIQ